MKKLILAGALLLGGIFTISAFINNNPQAPQTQKATAVSKDDAAIQWMSFNDAVALNDKKKSKKKIYVDVYTDWCGWCKRMDASTFTDPKIIKYMNDNYYAVKYNAESKDPVVFNGKTYNYVAQGARGYNELAMYLLNGQLSYPTAVYMDEDNNVIQALPGYKDASTLQTILTFFGTDSYKTETWDKFVADYKPE